MSDHSDDLRLLAAGQHLANLVLSLQPGLGTESCRVITAMARQALGLEPVVGSDKQTVVVEGKTIEKPLGMPIFALFGNDLCAEAAIVAWIEEAKRRGVDEEKLTSATMCLNDVRAWWPKYLPASKGHVAKPTRDTTPRPEEPAKTQADPLRLYGLCPMLFGYPLQPGTMLADIDLEGFWDPLAKSLIPGDVIFITASLPDGTKATLMRQVAELEPHVRVRFVR